MPGADCGMPGTASPLAVGRSASSFLTSPAGIAVDDCGMTGLQIARDALCVSDRVHVVDGRDIHREPGVAHMLSPIAAASATRVLPDLDSRQRSGAGGRRS